MDWKPITELQSVTCHTGSHSVTCHLTQVNTPHLNPSHAGLDLPTPEGWKAELTMGDSVTSRFTGTEILSLFQSDSRVQLTLLLRDKSKLKIGGQNS